MRARKWRETHVRAFLNNIIIRKSSKIQDEYDINLNKMVKC